MIARTGEAIMYRAAIERARAVRVWKAHNQLVHNNEKTDCVCDEQPNRFRKGERISGRCGNMHCQLCYGRYDEKRMKIPTHRQIKENLRYQDQLLDLELSSDIEF